MLCCHHLIIIILCLFNHTNSYKTQFMYARISFSLCILTQPRPCWSSDSNKYGAVSAAVDCRLLQTGFYWEEEKRNVLLEEQVYTQ